MKDTIDKRNERESIARSIVKRRNIIYTSKEDLERKQEEERQKETAEKRKSYLGVPVTTIAVLLPVFYMVYDYRIYRGVAAFPILLILMGTGFLLPVEIKKPGWAGKFCLVILGIAEMLGMIFFRGWALV